MTRINIIPPQNLSDELLVAEISELPRVFSNILKLRDKGIDNIKIPDEFTLNAGHMKFFYNKIVYLQDRLLALYMEHDDRKRYDYFLSDGYKRFSERIRIIRRESMFEGWLRTWQPRPRDYRVILERIFEKIPQYKRKHHYRGQVIETHFVYYQLLTKNLQLW